MTSPEKKTSVLESLSKLLAKLSDHDKDVLLAFGEGMAYKADQKTAVQ